MEIWQELLNSILFALLSAFLVAKLIALVVSLKYQGSNPTIVSYENESYFSEFPWDRVPVYENIDAEHELSPEKEKVRQIHIEDSVLGGMPPGFSLQSNEFCDRDEKCEDNYLEAEDEVILGEKPREVVSLMENVEFYFSDEISKKKVEDVSSHAGLLVKEEVEEEYFARDIQTEEKKEFRINDSSFLSDEDEWEKVENSEFDEIFGEAAVYVSSMAANLSQKIPNEVQIRLYGLHQIVTEGPCNISQPSPLKLDARAKWHVWQQLGNMNPEEAMEQYIGVVNKEFPNWNENFPEKKRKKSGSSQQSANSGGVTSVFSSFVHEEGSDDEAKLEEDHSNANEGYTAGLLQLLDQEVPVDSRDMEGQTALRYATVCETEVSPSN
ncbi:acyl-CoA-binding domain-containing protein 3 isoform X1 [Cryptomeria japonica]|uniref:acyl-CoA-binding domain-containing protein 3 isoform X1 n=1 Tax=Cryptomeria japonica TaxID=3369 RepID=UPI0027D9E752|nr:acyl-CoA-binding domain-containing protein 3 isoform X1 [Cryptomeria japonica]